MKLSTKELILISLFAALTAISAMFSIPIGPVPVTLQTFMVILSGIVLGSRLGLMSQLIYLLLGLIGLPVFSGGAGGLGTVLTPSFGFLIGFPISAYVIGKIIEKFNSKVTIILAVIIGSIIPYITGIPYFYLIFTSYLGKSITLYKTLSLTMIPFIPGDCIKAFVAITCGSAIVKYNFGLAVSKKRVSPLNNNNS